ncbi:hypothetical protein MFU01_85020 [Myxococcus fulvus]|uniref:Uncharacterized protein n=1 Tax=Myxococcus fulvus TaxID=33 RepID=A0A511TH14_MYXFU|nr:hypothetical protein MFU01_85020 [Myxococcus fulvus]
MFGKSTAAEVPGPTASAYGSHASEASGAASVNASTPSADTMSSGATGASSSGAPPHAATHQDNIAPNPQVRSETIQRLIA